LSKQPGSASSNVPDRPSLVHQVIPGPELLESAAGTLRMLAEPTRLHLLWQLSSGPKTVAELTAASGAARTVVSQHLAKLRLSGLVDTRKDGRHVIYSLNDGHLVRLIRETINHADHRITGEASHD
jgi:DNA-binding transcriptional ArsR family regulator